MTPLPGRGAVGPLIFVALAARMLGGLSLDLPDALNAVWLCPLLGLALFLPACLLLRQLAALGGGSPLDGLSRRAPRAAMVAAQLLFALLLVWDAASMIRTTAISCNIVSLSSVSLPLLILPLALMALLVSLMGLEAVGNSARVWIRFLPIPLLCTLLIQLRSYNAGWLAPVLGAGAREILRGGAFCAGCMALSSLPWMLAVPDRCDRGLARFVALAALSASLLLLLNQMLCPAQLGRGLTRIARIELLLSNGRLQLSPQMIINILWFGSMLYLIAVEAASAAAFLKSALPRAPKPLWPVLIALVSLALPLVNPAPLRAYSPAVGAVFAAVGGALAALAAISLIREEAMQRARP